MECPVCKNKRMNIRPWLGTIYECPKCGYQGPIALEKKKPARKKV